MKDGLIPWNLPERFLMIIPAPYYVTSLILSLILILIFEFIGERTILQWELENNFVIHIFYIISIAMSLVIGFQLFGIHFFLNKMRITFEDIGNLFENKKMSHDFRNEIQRNFSNSKLYYLTIILVISPFLINQLNAFLSEGNTIFQYGTHYTYWAFIFDIYNNLLSYISYYLLAVILWIIVNISWSIDMINSSIYKNDLKLNLFKADKMGGLKPLRNLLSSFSVYYFALIVLLIMSWLNPYPYVLGYSLLPHESKFLIIFWIIGVAFFIGGWYAIRKILFGKFEEEVNVISDLCQYKTQQLSDLISKDDSIEIEKQLDQVSDTLDALHKERERILNLGARPMDIKTLLLFLGSSIPSLIAIIKTLETLKEASRMEPVVFVLNNSQHIANHLANFIYYIMP